MGCSSSMPNIAFLPPLAAVGAASSADGSSLIFLITTVIIALAFDFTNGFHDTANAVATSISTRVLPARFAIIMAAVLNFLGRSPAQLLLRPLAPMWRSPQR